MKEYAELISYLGYIEMQALPPLPFLFHGCTGYAPEIILREGLKYTCEEPCLTYNPVTALIKYANPIRCSRNFHSGQARELAKHFTSEHEAAKYYDDKPECGGVLILPAGSIAACQAVTGSISEDRISVSGGITKWMFCHVSPGTGRGIIPPERLAGMIRPSGELAALFEEAVNPERTENDWEETAEKMIPVLMDQERADIRLPVQEIASGIARCAVTAGMLDFLRKIALSVMARDKKILKTDYPLEIEEFPAPFTKDLPEKIAAAEQIRCRDPWLETIRADFCRMLENKHLKQYE